MKLVLIVVVVSIGLLSIANVRSVLYGKMFAPMQTSGQQSCSDGWYITGYYVPREDELSGPAEQITVERLGDMSFSQEFLDEIRTEGWGITRFGWSLGFYAGAWHRADKGALDASGKPLIDGAIAIDRSVIPAGAQVQIATLPSPWGTKSFRATDIGNGIVGQHIDVFTGTGKVAEQETFRITSENNRVCVANSAATTMAGQRVVRLEQNR